MEQRGKISVSKKLEKVLKLIHPPPTTCLWHQHVFCEMNAMLRKAVSSKETFTSAPSWKESKGSMQQATLSRAGMKSLENRRNNKFIIFYQAIT